MRTAVLRDRAFMIEDRPIPTPGPGEVLLKTRLCGICGSDLHQFKHAAQIDQLARSMGAPGQDLAKGLVLGHEYVGEVVGFGPNTQQALQPGDRVVSVPFLLRDGSPVPIGANVEVDGAYAEYFLGTEALLLKIPDGVPDAAAALVEPLGIGVHAVAKSVLQGNSHACVILGCGPIGLAIAAVLRMRGVSLVIASDFSPKRRALATTMGATRAVHPREESPFAALPPGLPVIVFDCTGARGVLAQAINEVPVGAQIVVAGIPQGEDSFNPMVAIAKELNIQFVLYYAPEEFAEALAAIASGQLDWQPLVTGTVGLDGIAGAFAALEDPEVHAKIMIDPWSDAHL
ncbi:zinc-binding dehydrogenase [Novosphingobium sp.]|uniref:zinc-binding dehydrogenase n=1 Tax=Novosphingobium sp. TaxID=1874826 RepID=UPI0038BD25AB